MKSAPMTWKAVTRFVPGQRHLRDGVPCQDYGGDRILDQVVIGAVADGAGSAAYADVGAQLATTTVLKYLEASEQWLQDHDASWLTLPQEKVRSVAQDFFAKAINNVLAAFHQHAQTQRCEIQDFACTLLAFVATPDWIAAMQIGDGFLVVRLQGEEYQLIFQPDKGEYANQTTFVTSSDALETMQIQVLFGQQSFICAATDGLEPVAIRRADWSPFPPFFKPFEEFLQETADPNQEDSYLVDFLKSERLNQRTDDDKTMLLCLKA